MPCSSVGFLVLRLAKWTLRARALLRERELLLADQRRDRDERPPLDRLVHTHLSAAAALATAAGRARRLAVPVGDLRLAVSGPAAVGRVTHHPPHGRAIPDPLARARRDPLLCQPAREPGNRLACLAVAAEELAHDLGFALVDLPVALAELGLLDEP
jgi:hypothetical protein